jgi:polysaccharide biosynthesis transport protein
MSNGQLPAEPGVMAEQTGGGGRARRKAPPAPRKESRAQVTPQVVLYALSRWWLVALPLGIVLAASGYFAAMKFLPRTYRASAWVQIEADRPVLAYELPDSRKFVRNQFALLKSPLVLNNVLAQEEISKLQPVLEADPKLAFLEKGLSIQAVDNSDIYQISFVTEHQEIATPIVNAIVSSYLERRNDEAKNEVDETIGNLRKLMKNRQDEIADLRTRVQEAATQFAEKGDTTYLDPSDRNLIDKSQIALAPLQARLNEIEVELHLLEARKSLLAPSSPPSQPTGEVLSSSHDVRYALETDSLLQRLRMNQTDLQGRIKRAKEVNGWGEEHPRLKMLKSELADLGDTISDREREVIQRDQFQRERQRQQSLVENQQRDQRAVEEIERNIGVQQELKKFIQRQIADERSRLREGVGVEANEELLNLTLLQMELHSSEEVYNLLYNRISAMETEKDTSEGRVKVLKTAAADEVAVHSEPGPKALAGVLLGLMLPFGLAVLYEVRAQRITHGDQLTTESELPLIAEVSRLPVQMLYGKQQERIGTSRALYEESIDQLRTSLMVSDELQDVKVIATVSAVSGEGKSSIASQLAISLARATHQPVLIIDGDTRSPSLHDNFQLELEPGTVDLLRGRRPLEDVVQHHSELVHVVTAGLLDASPHALITSGNMQRLLEEARLRYRYIIVDCPPVLAASEAFVMAKVADAALVCAMRDISRGHQVKKACDRLRSLGVRTLGIVLSGVPTMHYRYRYGSYKYELSGSPSRSSSTGQRLPSLARRAAK